MAKKFSRNPRTVEEVEQVQRHYARIRLIKAIKLSAAACAYHNYSKELGKSTYHHDLFFDPVRAEYWVEETNDKNPLREIVQERVANQSLLPLLRIPRYADSVQFSQRLTELAEIGVEIVGQFDGTHGTADQPMGRWKSPAKVEALVKEFVEKMDLGTMRLSPKIPPDAATHSASARTRLRQGRHNKSTSLGVPQGTPGLAVSIPKDTLKVFKEHRSGLWRMLRLLISLSLYIEWGDVPWRELETIALEFHLDPRVNDRTTVMLVPYAQVLEGFNAFLWVLHYDPAQNIILERVMTDAGSSPHIRKLGKAPYNTERLRAETLVVLIEYVEAALVNCPKLPEQSEILGLMDRVYNEHIDALDAANANAQTV
jgi:hypothetical protein